MKPLSERQFAEYVDATVPQRKSLLKKWSNSSGFNPYSSMPQNMRRIVTGDATLNEIFRELERFPPSTHPDRQRFMLRQFDQFCQATSPNFFEVRPYFETFDRVRIEARPHIGLQIGPHGYWVTCWFRRENPTQSMTENVLGILNLLRPSNWAADRLSGFMNLGNQDLQPVRPVRPAVQDRITEALEDLNRRVR